MTDDMNIKPQNLRYFLIHHVVLMRLCNPLPLQVAVHQTFLAGKFYHLDIEFIFINVFKLRVGQ
jgi:hypothetical protein